MSLIYRSLLIIGLALIIIGSLLPWGCWGDFVTICKAGVVVSILNGIQFENNGGIIAISLSFIVVGLIIYKPQFLKNSYLWALVSAVILLLYSIGYIGSWLLMGIQQRGIIGGPTPGIGLGLILIGSIALLFLAIYRFSKTSI